MSIMLLDTNAIYLALLDLLTDAKRALIAQTDTGPRAMPYIEEVVDRLALIVHDGRPLAAELAAADKRHDIGCAALDRTCRLYTLLGALPEFAAMGPMAEYVRRPATR